uniref:Secreted protein n=1 Tax=Parascaris univalens TaxID=6257 RepID=A0A915AH88_PARUN
MHSPCVRTSLCVTKKRLVYYVSCMFFLLISQNEISGGRLRHSECNSNLFDANRSMSLGTQKVGKLFCWARCKSTSASSHKLLRTYRFRRNHNFISLSAFLRY